MNDRSISCDDFDMGCGMVNACTLRDSMNVRFGYKASGCANELFGSLHHEGWLKSNSTRVK